MHTIPRSAFVFRYVVLWQPPSVDFPPHRASIIGAQSLNYTARDSLRS